MWKIIFRVFEIFVFLCGLVVLEDGVGRWGRVLRGCPTTPDFLSSVLPS